MTRILSITCALVLGSLSLTGCMSQSPEAVAEAQFRAWIKGDGESFNDYFGAREREIRHDALLSRADTVFATYAATGERKPLMYFIKGSPHAIPIGLGMFPSEMSAFEVLSREIDGNAATLEVALTYPRLKSTMIAVMQDWESEIKERGEYFPLLASRWAPEEEKAEADARYRARASRVFRALPDTLRDTLRGTYRLERRWGRWKVVAEPITAPMMHATSIAADQG